MDSSDKVEVGGILRNGQSAVPLHINLKKLGFTQPPTTIKADNSAD